MSDALGALKPLLYGMADAIGFLFGTKIGVAMVAVILVASAVLRVAAALSARRLAAKAAGEKFGRAGAVGLALRELGSASLRAAAALPSLVAAAAAALGVLVLADSSRRLDRYLEDRARIAELTATVRNLERRYRAMDVDILDVSGGRIDAELSFYDYRSPQSPSKSQRIQLPGRELFIDAIVCNFGYSEIAAGTKVNLAIPYRAFTDETPQAEGVELGLLDEKGVPLMYRRPPEGVYGISAAAYDARLAELASILRSEETARETGIVRSLYGNALHRTVLRGDSFSIWVEQSGGLSIKDAWGF
jgi:hypothetical protein